MVERLKNEAGYSLVEVMVAIVLLGVAIIPMVSMFDTGLRSATRSSDYDKARAMANGKLEEIKAQSYSQVASSYPPTNGPLNGEVVPCNGPVESGFDCRVRTDYVSLDASGIVVDPDARTMMQVGVAVTWGGGKSYSMTGLVSE